MYRPKSYSGLLNNHSWTDSSSDGKPVQDSSSAGARYDEYNGAKTVDVSTFKRVKSHCIWCRHKLAVCLSSERVRQACLFSVLLLMVVGLWVLHAHIAHKASQPRHMVVLDAGSTGTRVHIFQYTADPRSSYAVLKLPEPKLKVEPGLSSYANDAAGAGASLQPLLAFAQQHVPAQQQQSTPIYLMATAGLRLLPSAAAESILEQCRNTLLASSFLFKPQWASIISGTSEGLYAWVAANYAAGNLQAAARNMRSRKEPRQQPSSAFKALIELGGASAQVTFMPEVQWRSSSSSGSSSSSTNSTSTEQESLQLSLPGVTRPLWSHSYLGYGFDVVEQKVDALVVQAASGAAGSKPAQPAPQQQQQQQRASSEAVLSPSSRSSPGVMDPCLPAGYVSPGGRMGSGEWQQCQVLVSQAMDPSSCRAAAATPCPDIPSQMPKLAGDLLAIENFAYTARALNLPERSSIGDFALAARRFCSRPWPQTLQEHAKQPEQQRYLWRYCFGSAFAWTLLRDVLHLSEGQAVQFTNTLTGRQGQEVGLDWALGATVLQLSRNGGDEGQLLRQQQQVERLVLLAALLGTTALLAAAGFTAARWQGSGSRAKAVASDGLGNGIKDGVENGETLELARSGRVYTYGPAASDAGRKTYIALPVSTRISE